MVEADIVLPPLADTAHPRLVAIVLHQADRADCRTTTPEARTRIPIRDTNLPQARGICRTTTATVRTTTHILGIADQRPVPRPPWRGNSLRADPYQGLPNSPYSRPGNIRSGPTHNHNVVLPQRLYGKPMGNPTGDWKDARNLIMAGKSSQADALLQTQLKQNSSLDGVMSVVWAMERNLFYPDLLAYL